MESRNAGRNEESQTHIAGYLEKGDFEYLKQECQEILSMLSGLIKHRNTAI
jgi:hypothetical protein